MQFASVEVHSADTSSNATTIVAQRDMDRV